MTALIDGDVLLYSSGFAAQKNVYYLDGTFYQDFRSLELQCEADEIDIKEARKDGRVETELQVFPENVAINAARKKLSEILETVNRQNDYIVVLSGDTNFRDDVAVTKKYKGNRDDKPKPEHHAAVKDWIMNGPMTKHSLRVSNYCEADDLISILAHKEISDPVVCSIDKDLCQIPGKHYDWYQNSKFKVPKHDALWFFLVQVLSGDSVDNIPGLKGFGDKTARKHLDEYRGGDLSEALDQVLGLYREKVGDEFYEYLEEQAQLLWMQREHDQVWSESIFKREVANVRE